MMIGILLFVELFITVFFALLAGIPLYHCLTADEWNPRDLVDVEREAGIDEEWR